MEQWRIVVAREVQWYEQFLAAPRSYSYGGGIAVAEYFMIDELVAPVPVFLPTELASMATGTVADLPVQGFAAGVKFDDEEAVDRLERIYHNDLTGVYSDPEIAFFPVDCSGRAVGTWHDVARLLDVAALRAANLDGSGVYIAIVDNGIDGTALSPHGIPLSQSIDRSSSYPVGYDPGTSARDHGTMVAFDALIAAPNARLFDMAMLKGLGAHPTIPLRLHHALAVYGTLVSLMSQSTPPGPLVISNSWGIADRSSDRPLGHRMNYCANQRHPFNLQVDVLVSMGVDVVFAAGNCGDDCPDKLCGAGDVGPGNSIHGANAHPEVITVAGVNTRGERVGYSAQGPGEIDPKKPDLAGYTQFDGSGWKDNLPDAGTSAAAPVVAGVIAALRQAYPRIPPAKLKLLLQQSAADDGAAWNTDIGSGVVHAGRALTAMQKEAAGGSA